MAIPVNWNMQQHQLFHEIQDIIGDFSLWPHNIQTWFIHGVPQGRGQRLRPIMAAFFWVNGLNPIVVQEWCMLNPTVFSERAVNHLAWLFQSFENGYLKYMYSYNITMGRYEKIDGTYHNPRPFA